MWTIRSTGSDTITRGYEGIEFKNKDYMTFASMGSTDGSPE